MVNELEQHQDTAVMAKEDHIRGSQSETERREANTKDMGEAVHSAFQELQRAFNDNIQAQRQAHGPR